MIIHYIYIMKKKQVEEGMLFPTEELDQEIEGTTPAQVVQEIEDGTTLTPRHRGRRRSMKTEERPPLTFEHMRELLEGIQEITTPTGIRYVQLRLTKRMIIGVRETSGKEFTINLDELFETYQNCLRFTSPEVKRHIFMGHSPAVILLRMLKQKAQEELL